MSIFAEKLLVSFATVLALCAFLFLLLMGSGDILVAKTLAGTVAVVACGFSIIQNFFGDTYGA